MTLEEASTIIRELAACFPSSKVTDKTTSAYAAQILEFDKGAAQRASQAILADCEYFPSVKKLRAAILAQGGTKNAWELALATCPSQKCQRCLGHGWVYTDPSTVAPCPCRFPDGACPSRLLKLPALPDRTTLPGAVLDVITQMEFTLGRPLTPSSILLLLARFKVQGEKSTVASIVTATRIAKANPAPRQLVGAVAEALAAPQRSDLD